MASRRQQSKRKQLLRLSKVTNRGVKQKYCKQPLCVACLAHTLADSMFLLQEDHRMQRPLNAREVRPQR